MAFVLSRPTRTALPAARVGPRKSSCAVALASDPVRRKLHNFMPGDARYARGCPMPADARWGNRRSAEKVPPYFQVETYRPATGLTTVRCRRAA